MTIREILERSQEQRELAHLQNSRWLDAFMNSANAKDYSDRLQTIFESDTGDDQPHSEEGEAGDTDGADGSEQPTTRINTESEESGS